MPFEKGHDLSKGRPKGSSNKLTTTFRELLTKTIHQLEEGDKETFRKWAEANKGEFYKIAARLIPTELVGEGGGKIQIIISKDEEKL